MITVTMMTNVITIMMIMRMMLVVAVTMVMTKIVIGH